MLSEDEKRHRLDELAKRDDIYQVWFRSYQELKDDFIKYADNQPEEVYRLLHGYVGCAAMAPAATR